MKEFRNLFVLDGSGLNVLAWRSRPVTDESCLSDKGLEKGQRERRACQQRPMFTPAC